MSRMKLLGECAWEEPLAIAWPKHDHLRVILGDRAWSCKLSTLTVLDPREGTVGSRAQLFEHQVNAVVKAHYHKNGAALRSELRAAREKVYELEQELWHVRQESARLKCQIGGLRGQVTRAKNGRTIKTGLVARQLRSAVKEFRELVSTSENPRVYAMRTDQIFRVPEE